MPSIMYSGTDQSSSDSGPGPDDSGPYESGAVCIPNISKAERRKRLNLGIVAFVVSLCMLAVLLATGMDRWWRLALLVPFSTSAFGFFEWRDKTCVFLSARGTRQLGEKVERITDRWELSQVRRQAMRVHIKSFVTGLALTGLIFLIP